MVMTDSAIGPPGESTAPKHASPGDKVQYINQIC
jgi:hypothetical protein